MAQNGKLELELVDVYGKRLKEKVDISLRNRRCFFAFVDKELRDEVKHSLNSGLFHSVSGSQHHLPVSANLLYEG